MIMGIIKIFNIPTITLKVNMNLELHLTTTSTIRFMLSFPSITFAIPIIPNACLPYGKERFVELFAG